MTKRPLLRINEVASRLQKSRSTVYRIIAAGDLPTVHVGTSGARVHPDDLDRYMRLNKVGEVRLHNHRQRKAS